MKTATDNSGRARILRRLTSLTSLTSLTIALATTGMAHALQTIDAADGVTSQAVISQREPTRLRIDGAPIANVFGNIHSNNCGSPAGPTQTSGMPAPPASAQVNPAGEIAVECDAERGEIYLRPVGAGTKPINLFVSSGRATYTLLLRRSDTPADTIVLRDKTPRPVQAPASAPVQGAAGHVRALKAMLVAMASRTTPSDITVSEQQRPVQLWQEARLTLTRLYEGRGYIGEQHSITNVSTTDMVLAEQEFDREVGDVVAVALRRHNLRPGEATDVFVIRRAGADQ
jgi:conjugal transfer pilus assembly protein TraK